jgi:hypothetical protein
VGKTVGVLLWMLRDVEASSRQALAGEVFAAGKVVALALLGPERMQGAQRAIAEGATRVESRKGVRSAPSTRAH